MIAYALALLALLSTLLLIRVSSQEMWIKVGLDASHGPIFALAAILLVLLLRGRQAANGKSPESSAWPDWRLYGKVLVVAVAIGVLIEYLQGFEGRPPSAFDVGTDTAGTLVGLALFFIATRPREPLTDSTRHGLSVLLALALAGLTFILWRPLEAARAYAHRAATFPVIAAYDAPVDLYFTSTAGLATGIEPLPARYAASPGERALSLRYGPGAPPAVQVLEPAGDWRGRAIVAADLANDGPEPIELVFRILDAHHDWSNEDRFNLPFTLPARTRTTIRLALPAVEAAPATRRMDMSAIANVMIFGHDPRAAGTLYVASIRLE